MEEHDFNFGHFQWIEFEEFPEIIEKIRKQFKTAGILELLKELNHMENEPNENKDIQSTKLTTIKRLIASKLDFFDNAHADYLIDTLSGYVEANEEDIKRLEKVHKAHRHDKNKAFTSKPIKSRSS